MAKAQNVVIKKVIRRIRPYSAALVASLVLALVQVAMTLYIPILVGNAIDCIIDAGCVDFDTMADYLGRIILCTAAAAGSQWVMSQINNAVTFRVTEDGAIRQVYFYSVDISEFAVNKLADRGSLSARGIVTNVQDFVVNLQKGLGL